MLISEDNVSRGKWPPGRVEEVHIGKDGLVRTATLRVQKSILTRPVQRLPRLEIESTAQEASYEEEVPVHGGEKLQSNVVPARSVPVPNPRLSVVLSDGGQGGKGVTARRTRYGRVVKKRERLDLWL